MTGTLRLLLLVSVVVAAGLALLLRLVRRPMKGADSKRRVLGCAVFSLVAATLLLEWAGTPFSKLSPVELVLPSSVPEDVLLREALLRALTQCPDGPLPLHDPAHSVPGVVEVRVASWAQFDARLRSVPGWDHIVLLGPMESGHAAAGDSRFASARVRRQLEASRMDISDIFFFQMLVVRGDDIVARPILYVQCGEWFGAESDRSEADARSGEPSQALWIIDALPAHGAGLAERLERALTLQAEGPLRRTSAYPDSGAAVVEGRLSLEEFRRRASTVEGWDQIVFIGPYDDKRSVADDPALTTDAVRTEVREAYSWPSDEMKELLVIRAGRVVDRLTIECVESDFWSCVVERAP